VRRLFMRRPFPLVFLKGESVAGLNFGYLSATGNPISKNSGASRPVVRDTGVTTCRSSVTGRSFTWTDGCTYNV
jgi:hypothetical protein